MFEDEVEKVALQELTVYSARDGGKESWNPKEALESAGLEVEPGQKLGLFG